MSSTENNLIGFFTGALIIVTVTYGYAVFQAMHNREMVLRETNAQEKLMSYQSLMNELFETETALRGFVITGEISYFREYTSDRLDLEAEFEALSDELSSVNDPDLEGLASMIQQRLIMMDELFLAKNANDSDAATAMVAGRKDADLTDMIRDYIQGMESGRARNINSFQQEINESSGLIIYIFIISAAVNSILLMAAFFVLRRKIRHETQLMENTARKSNELALSSQLINSLQSCSNNEEAGKIIHYYMLQLFHGSCGALYVMNDSHEYLDLITCWNIENDSLYPVNAIKPDDCWALHLGKTHRFVEGGPYPDCSHSNMPGGAYVCVPIITQGETAGLLHIQFRHPNQAEVQVELVEFISSQIAASLINLILRMHLLNQSIRDPLTDLYNRRYLEEIMEREILLSRRNKTPLSIIMLDIDYFKRFNDNHGHQTGDELLKACADFMRRNMRGSDIVCRYGGEEFIILLPGSSLVNTRERAEKFRLGLHDIRVESQGKDIPAVTGSFGIAAFPENGDTWQDIVRMADQALYQAKQEGRDRIVVSKTMTSVPSQAP